MAFKSNEYNDSKEISMISDGEFIAARQQEMERDILPNMQTKVVLPRSKKTVTIYSRKIKL